MFNQLIGQPVDATLHIGAMSSNLQYVKFQAFDFLANDDDTAISNTELWGRAS